jgi:Na+-transporting NADH:ubiquinone oxidoreductase subunit NqrD
VSLLVPLDEETIVSAVDGVGDGVGHGDGLLAVSEKEETPRIGGFLKIGAANS